MTKSYKQELRDLNNGLEVINKAILKPKDSRFHEKALINRDIQQARIDFFKLGYAFRNRELKAQQTLKLGVKNG